MKITQATDSLTSELIRELLQRNASSCESAEYVRLMEIYCVVKAGGVAEQIAVARRLEEKERAALQEEIQNLTGQEEVGSRMQALEQEIQELEKSIASRLQYLSTICSEEEATVRRCLPEIDTHFRTLRHLGESHSAAFNMEREA